MAVELRKDISVGVRYIGDKHVVPMFKTDHYLSIFSPQDIDMPPGTPALVKTGVVIDVPEGYEAQFRSSLDLIKKRISIMNLGASIERGEHEVVVVVINQTNLQQVISEGEELCRLAFIRLSSGEAVPKLEVPTLVTGT